MGGAPQDISRYRSKDIGIIGGGRRKPTASVRCRVHPEPRTSGRSIGPGGGYGRILLSTCSPSSFGASFELVAGGRGRAVSEAVREGLGSGGRPVPSSSCSTVLFDTALMRVRRPPDGGRSPRQRRSTEFRFAATLAASTVLYASGLRGRRARQLRQQPDLRRRAEGAGSEADASVVLTSAGTVSNISKSAFHASCGNLVVLRGGMSGGRAQRSARAALRVADDQERAILATSALSVRL